MKFYHVYSDYDRTDGEALRRHEFAKSTWTDPRLAPRPVHDRELTRSSRDLGDTRSLPFVRDVIDRGAGLLPIGDALVLTNDDTCMCEDAAGQVIDAMRTAIGCFAHRWDVANLTRPLKKEEIKLGAGMYPGFDLFAFTVAWWMRHRDNFPDLIIGCEWWDCVLWQMLKKSGAVEVDAPIYHEQHAATWCQPGFIDTNPGQVHNRRVAAEWCDQNRPPNMVKLGGQLKVVQP